jgi:hypothetical protein
MANSPPTADEVEITAAGNINCGVPSSIGGLFGLWLISSCFLQALEMSSPALTTTIIIFLVLMTTN